MYEATFTVGEVGSYAVPTRETGSRIELWCTDHCDLLSVRGGDVGAVLRQVDADVGIRDSLRAGDAAVVVTAACLRDLERSTIDRYLAEHGCLLVPPIRYADGEKHCRLIALDPGALSAVYRDLVGDGFAVDVTAKREISLAAGGSLDAAVGGPRDTTGERGESAVETRDADGDSGSPVGTGGPLFGPTGILPVLTERQRETFLVAYDAGYYEVPRGTTTAEIAAATGVQRRTAEEHLRRAERKLVDALVPYLRA